MKLSVTIRTIEGGGKKVILSNTRLTYALDRSSYVLRSEMKMAFRSLENSVIGLNGKVCNIVRSSQGWNIYFTGALLDELHIGCCSFSPRATKRIRKWAMAA